VDAPLEFRAASKAYADFALRDISFAVPRGYIVGLVGPNGAGKTTLLRLALGLAAADGGTVRLFGRDPRHAPSSTRARIGFVHEVPAFYDHLSVGRFAALVASFYPTWDAALFDGLAGDFGLRPRAKVGSLSRGTRMKLALALALSHRAELLLLDEPTGGLDPVFRDALLDQLTAAIGDGRGAVLFSTQIVADLERIADFIVLVRNGRLLYSGPKDDIVDRWAVVRGGPELATDLAAASPRGMVASRGGVEALFEDGAGARQRFGGRAVVEDATLEDAFLLCREPSRREP
jgi:ABC-2 type transport system ATP-binding protein